MRYDPQSRVLSISFVRDAEEHTDMLLDAGRRMVAGNDDDRLAWGRAIGVAIGFGVTAGTVMELYRRFVLPLILDPTRIAPLGIAAIEVLPFFLLVVALYLALHARGVRRQRQAVLSKLRPGVYVDVDIFANGISIATDQVTIEINWSSVRSIYAVRKGMEIEIELSAIYIPERAFDNHAAFVEAGKQIRDTWREAQKREHDGKMIAAGLD